MHLEERNETGCFVRRPTAIGAGRTCFGKSLRFSQLISNLLLLIIILESEKKQARWPRISYCSDDFFRVFVVHMITRKLPVLRKKIEYLVEIVELFICGLCIIRGFFRGFIFAFANKIWNDCKKYHFSSAFIANPSSSAWHIVEAYATTLLPCTDLPDILRPSLLNKIVIGYLGEHLKLLGCSANLFRSRPIRTPGMTT